MNKVMLIGRLGHSPETRYTQSGQPVCNFNLATSKKWTGKDGQRHEETEWHKVVVWGKLAELCQQYLVKGRQCFVEGEIKTRQYQGKDGSTKYSTEIIALSVEFLGDRQQGQADVLAEQNTPMFTDEDIPF